MVSNCVRLGELGSFIVATGELERQLTSIPYQGFSFTEIADLLFAVRELYERINFTMFGRKAGVKIRKVKCDLEISSIARRTRSFMGFPFRY